MTVWIYRTIQQLIDDEGWRNSPYLDTRGVWTIGCGHNMATPITDTAVRQILDDDVKATIDQCVHLSYWPKLNDARKSVIVNMAFNLGMAGLGKFQKMVDAIQRDDYTTAADEMLDSLWSKQVGQRAHRLASIMRTGEWPNLH